MTTSGVLAHRVGSRPERYGAGAGALLAVAGAGIVAGAPRGVLLAVLLPVQLLLAYVWLRTLRAPVGGLLIAAGAAVAGDLLLVTRDAGASVGALAGVVGLGVVAAVVGQLVRRDRSRVTDVLAAHSSAVLLVVAVAPVLALPARTHGDRTVAAGLLGVALALLAALLVPARRAPLAGWVGGLLGAGLGAAVGATLTDPAGPVAGAVAGVLAGLALLLAPRADDLAAGLLGPLLAFALAAPGVLVVGRALLP